MDIYLIYGHLFENKGENAYFAELDKLSKLS